MPDYTEWSHPDLKTRNDAIYAVGRTLKHDKPLPDGIIDAVLGRLEYETEAKVLSMLIWLVCKHPDLSSVIAIGQRIDMIAEAHKDHKTLTNEIDRYEQVRRTRDQIFISYSHDDKTMLDELLRSLKPLQKRGLIGKVWTDKDIKPGDKWKEEIDEALRHTKIGILMVSQSFMDSEFIIDEELPVLCDAAERREVTLLSIILEDCRFDLEPCIASRQFAYSPEKKMFRLSPADRATAWTAISRHVENVFNAN